MREFNRMKPPEVFKIKGEYTHRLELKVDDKEVGFAKFEYYNKPFPFYYLSYVEVDGFNRGNGYGKAIIQKIYDFGFMIYLAEPDPAPRDMF